MSFEKQKTSKQKQNKGHKMNKLLYATKLLKDLQKYTDCNYEGEAEYIFMQEITQRYYFDVRKFVLETTINISAETKNLYIRQGQSLKSDQNFFDVLKQYHISYKDILKNISASDFIEKTFN